MIAQPACVAARFITPSFDAVRKKKNPKALAKVRFDRFEEGQSAQIMHLGPFATEHDNIIRLHDHIHASHHTENGRHHEIYRGDFRKVAPEKMKTVLRQPFC